MGSDGTKKTAPYAGSERDRNTKTKRIFSVKNRAILGGSRCRLLFQLDIIDIEDRALCPLQIS